MASVLTAEQFEKRIDEIIEYCRENNVPPSNYVVEDVFGITARRLSVCRQYENELEESPDGMEPKTRIDHRKFFKATRKLDNFRNEFWLRQGLSDPKMATFAIFNLKQPMNGGYTDKPLSAAGNTEVVVKLEGVGGSEAFK